MRNLKTTTEVAIRVQYFRNKINFFRVKMELHKDDLELLSFYRKAADRVIDDYEYFLKSLP